jgi:3-isopropylmalate/(R)-2-methylmalate dehydratase small subunit
MSSAARSRVAGAAIVLRGSDIDTDRIMPARFLRTVTFEGLEAHLFADERLADERLGRTHPLDDPARRGARVLLVNANFGCGSSREHAPQGLVRWGIRAIVGESFGEIFFANALALGLPCVTAARPDVEQLMEVADRASGAEFVVDLVERVVTAGGLAVPIGIPEAARLALVSGDWDVTGRLLDCYEEVERTRARIPYLGGFEST